jgi:dihydropteroate synthase
MPFVTRSRFSWRLRSRSLPLGRHTLLMGILNVTPDSFSDGDHYNSPRAAHDHGLFLLDEGADLVDIGGESTRPDAAALSPQQEQERVLPVIRAILKARPDAILSVDTYHAATAELAIQAGVEVVNDVSGLIWDPRMAAVMARDEPGSILMHTRGAPRAWTTLPPLPHSDIMPLVIAGLAHTLSLARAAGMNRSNMVLDPGFGFGKMGDENFVLLAHFAELHQFALPFLVGVSRKRFLTAHLSKATDASRQEATTAAHVAAILAGAHLLRVHDVAAARAAASVADAILSSMQPDAPEGNPAGVRKIQAS